MGRNQVSLSTARLRSPAASSPAGKSLPNHSYSARSAARFPWQRAAARIFPGSRDCPPDIRCTDQTASAVPPFSAYRGGSARPHCICVHRHPWPAAASRTDPEQCDWRPGIDHIFLLISRTHCERPECCPVRIQAARTQEQILLEIARHPPETTRLFTRRVREFS